MSRLPVSRLAASALGVAAVVGLAAFHLLLLWERVVSLTLLEPMVAVRWAASRALLGALVRLRRAGVPVLWGRRAAVLWLLVLLLHLAVPGPQALVAGASGTQLLLILPLGGAVVAALTLALDLCGRAAAAPAQPGRPLGERRPCPPLPLLAGFPASLFSRPPPAVSR